MPPRHTPESLEIPREDVSRQLDRILNYEGLQASVRRRRMLKYIVRETLEGRASALKATTIAMAVFDRGIDFDQQTDPVVRLEARKLRRDLDNYYVTVGQLDPIRISIPKGHYRPKFERHHVQAARADTVVQSAPGLADEQPGPRFRILGHSRVLIGAGLVVLAFVAAAATYKGLHDKSSRAAVLLEEATIRVVGFEARDDDELSALLAAGLSQQIAAALLKFQDLKVHHVPAPGAAAQSSPTSEVAQPSPAFSVTGAVWREGMKVLVRAELLRSADARVLWSDEYSQYLEGESISVIENDISSRIATIAGQRYGLVQNDVRGTLADHETDPSLIGYACVARAQIYQRTYADELYGPARQCLEETVESEPNYARAWAMLAILRNDAARFGRDKTMSRDEGFVHAREAAARALAIDPRDPDALKAMSHIEQYAGNLEASIEWARRAVEENPNDPTSLANLGYRLGIVNRFDEAVPLLEKAIERSIAAPPFYFHMIAMSHMMEGDWQSMMSPAISSVADGSSISFALAAIAHWGLGNRRAAREYFEKTADRWPLLADDPTAALKAHQLDPKVVEVFATSLVKARAFSMN